MKKQNNISGKILMKELRTEETLKIKAGYNPWLDEDQENNGD